MERLLLALLILLGKQLSSVWKVVSKEEDGGKVHCQGVGVLSLGSQRICLQLVELGDEDLGPRFLVEEIGKVDFHGEILRQVKALVNSPWGKPHQILLGLFSL